MTKQIGQIGAAIPLKNTSLVETDTWSDTLARGNTSAGNDAVMTIGDIINHLQTNGKTRDIGTTFKEFCSNSEYYIDADNASFLDAWMYATARGWSTGVGSDFIEISDGGTPKVLINFDGAITLTQRKRNVNYTTANQDFAPAVLNSRNATVTGSHFQSVLLGGTGLANTKANQALAQILTGKDLIEYVSSATAITANEQVPHKLYVDQTAHQTITAQSANYNAVNNDFVLMTAGATDKTVTLPASPNANDIIAAKLIDSGAGNLIISGNGNNIDGAATLTITAQWDSVVLQSDGTNWFIK